MLTQNEFDLLDTLAGMKERLSQRQIAEALGWSLVNKQLKLCTDAGYCDGSLLCRKPIPPQLRARPCGCTGKIPQSPFFPTESGLP